MVLHVRTVLRYLLVSGLVVALAWGVFVVRVGGRTLYGHTRTLGDTDVGNAWTRLKSGLDERLEELNGATAEERKKNQVSKARAAAQAKPKAKAKKDEPKKGASARKADKPAVAARAAAKPVRDPVRPAAPTAAAKGAAPSPAAVASAPAAARPPLAVAATPARRKEDARVERLGEAQALARAMHRADAAAPPRTTKVDERASGSRVDALLTP
jgi:hypothetical protein